MKFPGQDHCPPAPQPKDRPMRTFTYKTWGGKDRTVQANYAQFTPGHVQFWQDRPSPTPDLLVLAETNENVRELREVDA